MTSKRGWLIGSVVAVVTVAAFLRFGPPLNRLALPTTDEPEGIGMTALYEGKVLGDVNRGCLSTESGHLIVWPKGFYALDNPPRVMRPIRQVAARVGEEVSLGGGFAEASSAKCGTTGEWIVSTVESLSE